MKKVLVLFSHPAIQKSRVNTRIIHEVKKMDFVTFHDLYEKYPDYYINIENEQKLLTSHDIIIFQHPFYWYSCPSLLKEWIDLVLEYEFAYGPGGNSVKDKKLMSVITTGATKEAYTSEGYNKYSIREFLLPFEQTANLCQMQYLPPFVIHDAINMNVNMELHGYIKLYTKILRYLANDKIDYKKLFEYEYINDYFKEI